MPGITPERVAALLLAEEAEPEGWWYLSFATSEGFLGGVFVKARGPATANRRTHRLGVNPGGEVMMCKLDPAAPEPAPDMVDRLLSRREIEGRMGAGETVTRMPDGTVKVKDAGLIN
jgi:hypothetical protein